MTEADSLVGRLWSHRELLQVLAPWLTRAEHPLHRSSLALGREGAHVTRAEPRTTSEGMGTDGDSSPEQPCPSEPPS